MKGNMLYLIHIQECIQRIQEYTEDGEETFRNSRLIQDAVIRNLQTLSESTMRLSDDIKEKYGDIDWGQIAAFRNVIVHDYLGIDLDKIWNILEEDLPELKLAIEEMILENQ